MLGGKREKRGRKTQKERASRPENTAGAGGRVAGWQGGALVKLAPNSGSRVTVQEKPPTKILDLPKPLIPVLQRLQRALMGTESNMDLQGHPTD